MSVESKMLQVFCECHCQACGIKLSLENSMNGVECIMCAIPMADKNKIKDGGIIATHYSQGCTDELK